MEYGYLSASQLNSVSVMAFKLHVLAVHKTLLKCEKKRIGDSLVVAVYGFGIVWQGKTVFT